MIDSLNVSVPVTDLDVRLNQPSGYPDQLAASDTIEAMFAAGARDFPSYLLIPESDWQNKAQENDKYGTWPEDYSNRFTNQNPTHECTCHALTQGFEIAWNRQRKGKGDPVFVSPLSIYAEANPGQWGGATMQGTVGIAIRRGFLPDKLTPGAERFRHTLIGTCGRGNATQSNGSWTPVSQFPSGWQETAKHLRALEVINPTSYQQIVSLVLHGICVCVGRSGHAIPYTRVVWDGGQLRLKYKDSYDVFRYDSLNSVRAGVGGSYAIFTTTVPDDWDRPAG